MKHLRRRLEALELSIRPESNHEVVVILDYVYPDGTVAKSLTMTLSVDPIVGGRRPGATR